jgi:endoglucanase Acf2
MRSHAAILLILVGLAWCGEAPLPDDLPQVVQVGAGSYASRPPRDQNKRPGLPGKAAWGDDSQIYSNMRLWVTPGLRRPVPSTDWWTSLVSTRWSGDLWAYPAVVRAQPDGIVVAFPRTWDIATDGKRANLISVSRLIIGGEGFAPLHAEAEDWSDWLVRMRLPDGQGRALRATIGHGLPYTWVEPGTIEPCITIGEATLSGPGASAASDRLGVTIAGDSYGIYAPPGTRFVHSGGRVALQFAGKARWLAVAPLPAIGELDRFAAYAAVIPRSTRVTWDYRPERGVVDTTWTLTTEDLDGKGRSEVMQGWIPHHYQAPAKAAFAADGPRYVTPRGEMRCAVGNRFNISLPFAGLLPEYPAPEAGSGPDAYRPEVMRGLVTAHLGRPGYGSETYWGGKKVLLLARYMELARQLGMTAETAVLRDRAAEAVRDWLTFTPGEGEHFFAWYPNWGSFVGCRSRDNANPGVDVLQDHHMCYGYHVYAAALISLQDPAFATDWGPMARLMARDYANWDESDGLFCRFRNLDPWCGHSWSGGMGTDHGNGQESSSEAMQGYGAMFLLGEALGDTAMRDAAAFCWATEARGIAEYYFDRGHRNFPAGWNHTVVSNLHTEGLGFWTWFSGNPFWMHAIQWIPMSPLLSYLGEDPAYAAADFAQMMKTHEGGQGWDGYLGTDGGVSNIAMNYLATSDPAAAAGVFQRLLDRGLGGVKAAEAGPTYWRIHALRRLGVHRFDAWTDVATSQAFRAADGSTSWVVFNASDVARTVRCFEGGRVVATFSAPARRLSVMRGGTVTSGPGAMAPVPPPTTVDDGLPLSEGRSATASSTRGRENGPEAAFDGDPGTRWSSRATDDEWIAVDLGVRCRLTRVALDWEAAFGKDYDLQGSDDGQTWKTLAEVRAGDGGHDEVPLVGEARHIRLQGRARGTSWGWSLFTVAVFGEPLGGGAQRLVIEPPLAQLGERQTTRFAAFAVDRAGTRTPAQVRWTVVGKGSIAADGTFTPQGGGTFDAPRVAVVGEAGGLRARAWAVVEEARRVANIALTPTMRGEPLLLGVGMRIPVAAEAQDQFKAWIAQAPTLSVEGPVRLDGGQLVATGLGKAMLRAELAGVRAELPIEVVPPERVDLAAGCSASASSSEGGNTPEAAVDRDPKTRWASAASDPQWLAVDLGQVRSVRRLVLRWENAHARSYRIDVSDDGANWKTVHEQPNCRGKVEEIALPSAAKARYVRMQGLTRAGGYGYSLFALEVFGG